MDHEDLACRVDKPLASWRIFFLSLCFGDRRSWGRPMFNPFMRYTAYARVRALRVKRLCRAQTDAIVIADRIFRDFFFIGLFLVTFRSQELRRMLDAANSKKI